MGRIVATVDVRNFVEPSKTAKIDALVDTGASYPTLPTAWKERFGSFDSENEVELRTATQETATGTGRTTPPTPLSGGNGRHPGKRLPARSAAPQVSPSKDSGPFSARSCSWT